MEMQQCILLVVVATLSQITATPIHDSEYTITFYTVLAYADEGADKFELNLIISCLVVGSCSWDIPLF